MQILVDGVMLGFVLFYVTHMDIFIFLLRNPISYRFVEDFANMKPKQYMKIAGTAYGYCEKKGTNKIVLDLITFAGRTVLQIDRRTRMIGLDVIATGDLILAKGKIVMKHGCPVIMPTAIVCSNKPKLIIADLSKRLSIYLCIGVLLEVIKFVIHL